MAAVAARAPATERALIGAAWNEASIDAAVAKLAEDFKPLTDMRASSAYRLQTAGNLLRRFYFEHSGVGRPYPDRRRGRGVGLTLCQRATKAHIYTSAAERCTRMTSRCRPTLCTRHSVMSSIAHGRIRALDLAAVLESPGVVAVALAADVPGENNYGSAVHDDPIFAPDLVQYVGQPLFAVAADSYTAARKAARRARVEYEPLPAILDIRAALAAQATVLPTQRLTRGRPHEALAEAPHRMQGTVHIGGQDHFYLEGQIAIAVPQEDGAMLVHSSTQHPSEVQQIVAHALGKQANQVTVQCRRMGGGFGGKETQPALIAAAAAVLAQ